MTILIRNQKNQLLACLFVTLTGLFVLTRSLERNHNIMNVVVEESSSSHSNAAATTPPLLVFEVGLPRSGSIAIYNYFNCQQSVQQQQQTLHYCCDPTKTRFPCGVTIGQAIHANALEGNHNHKPLLENCGSPTTRIYTALGVESSEPYGYFLPQHFALPLLYKDYPDAVWILPMRRDAATWATSVLHWHSETQRYLSSFGLLSANTRVAPANDQEAARITKGLQAAVEQAYDSKTHAWKRQQLQRHLRQSCAKNGDLLVKEFPSLSQQANCWSLDASSVLDDDWKNLTLPF